MTTLNAKLQALAGVYTTQEDKVLALRVAVMTSEAERAPVYLYEDFALNEEGARKFFDFFVAHDCTTFGANLADMPESEALEYFTAHMPEGDFIWDEPTSARFYYELPAHESHLGRPVVFELGLEFINVELTCQIY